MRVPDRCLAELRERGYLRFEGFLNADELVAAQEGVWLHYPRPEEYFADPAAYAWPATDQWAGIIRGAWKSWNLNRLAFHPDLLDLAERFLCSAGSLDSVRRVRPRRSQLMTQVPLERHPWHPHRVITRMAEPGLGVAPCRVAPTGWMAAPGRK